MECKRGHTSLYYTPILKLVSKLRIQILSNRNDLCKILIKTGIIETTIYVLMNVRSKLRKSNFQSKIETKQFGIKNSSIWKTKSVLNYRQNPNIKDPSILFGKQNQFWITVGIPTSRTPDSNWRHCQPSFWKYFWNPIATLTFMSPILFLNFETPILKTLLKSYCNPDIHVPYLVPKFVKGKNSNTPFSAWKFSKLNSPKVEFTSFSARKFSKPNSP